MTHIAHPSSDPRTVRVDRLIPSSPETVFDLLATPARHAEFAGSGQVLGIGDNSPARLSEGARFGMRTRQVGLTYVSSNQVVEFEENRRLAWTTWGVIAGRKRVGGHIWRFLLEPEPGGVRVIHEYEWWRATTPKALQILRYPQRSEQHMRATLERLERVVTGRERD